MNIKDLKTIKKSYKKANKKYLIDKNKKEGLVYISESQLQEFYNNWKKAIEKTGILDKGVEIVRIGGNLFDNVDHSAHYTQGREYEPIKVINDWDLGFNLGNTVKYISRAGRKQDFKGQNQIEKTIEDLKKAQFYLNYEIKELEEKLQNEEIKKQLEIRGIETREIN